MRHKSMFRIILGILTTGMVTLILISSAGAQATFKTLHKFKGGTDGNSPNAGLIFDQAGNLYSTTVQGGGRGWGNVFQLTPNQNGGWTEHTLYSFCSLTNCADGAYPLAGLIFDQAGNLYGTTAYGGAGNAGAGTVFKLVPNQNGGWTESVLYSFCSRTNCADGEYPYAGVIFDQAGKLYGTTDQGGAQKYRYGTVFQLTPNRHGGWTEHVLHSFCSRTYCTDGSSPGADLIFDQAGNLYGTTIGGFGAHFWGTVFQLTPNQHGGWTEHVLHAFLDKPGAFPSAGLILDKGGNLYGTTEGDHATTFGSVFEVAP